MKKTFKEDLIQNEGGDTAAPAEEGKPSRKDHYKNKNPDFKVLDCGMNAETGINMERGCTDVLCVGLFLTFIATMFGVAIFGLVKGDPKAFIKPYDFTNSICGVNDTVKDYGKLYFT